MSSNTALKTQVASGRPMVRTLIVLNAVIVLFPPLHWWVGSPGSYASLVYFIAATVLLLVSLVAIYMMVRTDGDA